jgi:radical SAM protein (TIGR01212 family)
MEPYYNDYASVLKHYYHFPVYKLPVNLAGGTCPNRDGRISRGGCAFCDETGSGFQCLSSDMDIRSQLAENKAFYRERFGCNHFIVYLQTFSNTYMPLSRFKRVIEAAADDDDIVGISVSTRPDLVHPAYLQALADLARDRDLDVDIELGLQTANYHTLADLNRGHSLACFIDAAARVRQAGFSTCAHVILNLPGDDRQDVIETARILSACRVDMVKLHSLYIVAGTALGRDYQLGRIQICSLEEYVERVVDFLEYLDPRIIIQRLVGKGPLRDLLFCNWDTSWWKIKDAINDCFCARGTFQGARFDYLNGALIDDLAQQ